MDKRLGTFIIFALTAFMSLYAVASSKPAHAQSVLGDGGFETGQLSFGAPNPTGSWGAVAGSGGTVAITTEDKHSGINSTKIVSGSAGDISSYGYVYQFFNLGTSTFTFSFWYRGLAGTMGAAVNYGWTLGCGCGTSVGLALGAQGPGFPVDGEWHLVTLVRTPSIATFYLDGSFLSCASQDPGMPPPSSVYIGDGSTYGSWGTFYFDDVSLEAGILLPSTCNVPARFNSFWNASSGSLPDQACPPWSSTLTTGPNLAYLSSGHLVFNTTALGEKVAFEQFAPDISFHANATIEARLKFVSGTSTNTARAPAAIAFTTSPGVGNALFIGQDEIFVLSSDLARGHSAAVDTHLAFHTYRITVNDTGYIRVFQDGVQVLVGTTYNSTGSNGTVPAIVFGEFSSAAHGVSEWEFVRHDAHAFGCHCIPPPSGLVSWWPGDGNANDIVGSRNGTLMNGASFGPGIVGPAFSFSGANQYVNITNSPGLQVSAGNFTAGAWVKFNAVGGDMSILDNMGNGGTNQDGWRLLKQSDNHFWFCLGGGLSNGCPGPGSSTLVISTTVVSPGVWYHVAAVKTSGSISIYVNGTLDGTTSLGPFTDTNSANLLIGAYPGLGLTAFLNGLVDEAQLYHQALNASQIQSIFEAGSAGCCKTATLPALHITTTAVNCVPSTVVVNQASACTVTVTDTNNSPSNPAGSVAFSNGSSSGKFDATTCSLAASGLNAASCTVSYTPGAVGSGSQSITASYGGDSTHQSSVSAGFTLTVNPAPDFSLTPTSITITVAVNSLGTDKLRVDAIHGFTGTVSFLRVGSPFGGVSYDCSSVTLSLTTISADSICTFGSNTPGTYTAIVNGTGGTPSVSHQVTYTVIVVKNTPSIHTTLSTSTITVGGSVTDSATLTGTDTLTAGGTVTYEFFTGSSCAGTATVVGTPVIVNSGVIPNSVSQTFSSGGLFSWNAMYSGDANNDAATSLCEPLQVNPLTGVAVTTKLSATTITVGGSVSDSATLSGVTADAGGTVVYDMFNIGDCSSPVIVVATVDVTNGVVPNSPSRIFSSPGFFGWNAAYSGDANNVGADSICEALTVNKASPTLSTTLSATTITVGGSVSDTVTLASGFTQTGSVSFSFYSGDCSSGIVTIILPPVGLIGSSATSVPQTFNSAGSFSWKAVYLGDSNNDPAPSPCEPLTVTKTSPTIATTLSATAITVGGSVTDASALTGSFNAGGTVTYEFFSGSTCTSSATTVGASVNVVNGVVPNSVAQAFNGAGPFSWKAVYSGDPNNNGATSSCESLSVVEAAGFTISGSPTSLTVAPGEARSCEGQGAAQRCDDEGSSTVTVTGLNGFSDTVTLAVSTAPGLTVSLSTLRITGSGSSILTLSDGRPGNYTVTITGTSGSITHSVVVNVMVRPPVPLKCGGDSDCNIESDAPLSDVRFGDKKIHFIVDGTAGARGAVNVTIPRSAVSDIDRIEVSVDGVKQPHSALMIAADDSNYHVYFSFTFHSPVVIVIDLSPAVTILGLSPLVFYGIVGVGIAIVVAAGVFTLLRRRGAKEQLARTL